MLRTNWIQNGSPRTNAGDINHHLFQCKLNQTNLAIDETFKSLHPTKSQLKIKEDIPLPRKKNPDIRKENE